MSIYKSYAVFGLGRFGYAVAKELSQSGAEVLAVDANEAVVNAVSGEIPLCKCADVTDPEVLDRLGIAGFDVVIVAMANSLEASVLTTTLCKELGVKTVIAKVAAVSVPDAFWGDWFQLLFAAAMVILSVILVVEGVATFSKQAKKAAK